MSTTYILLHKNIPVCAFELETEVVSAVVNEKTAAHLPLPLKRIVHQASEFVSEKRDANLLLNEEGCSLVDFWLNDRTVPVNRKNRYKYGGAKNKLAWMLENHACSLDDCYWIRTKEERMTWEDVRLYGYDKVDILTQENLADQAHYNNAANSTLGGELEKYWFCQKTDNGTELFLCKKTSPSNDILIIREKIANMIYENQGYSKYCRYQYVYNTEHQLVGCFCKAFTTESLELITAYDLLEEYNLTQQEDLYRILAERAEAYGFPVEQTREYLDIQAVVDFLITNRDRHQGNIGFLRDPDSLKIIQTAPVYDSGSSESMEYELPIDTEHTRVNGLYHTERECLEHVSDLRKIDLSKLPNSEMIKKELEMSGSLSQKRKDFLVKLYQDKIAVLKSMQAGQ